MIRWDLLFASCRLTYLLFICVCRRGAPPGSVLWVLGENEEYFLSAQDSQLSFMNQILNYMRKTMPWISTIASVSMEVSVQKGCLPGEVCLFYFIFIKNLSRITFWDVTFYFHKHIQGVRAQFYIPWKQSLLQCLLDFSKCHFQPILCTNGLQAQENIEKKRKWFQNTVLSIITLKAIQGRKPSHLPSNLSNAKAAECLWYGKAHC